ncbi:MAG: hypothetical protein ABH851_05505 [Methanobacteriota archaeon]
MINNKGYTVILDSLFAFTITVMLFAGLWGAIHYKPSDTSSSSFKRLHYISEDSLEVLNKKGVLDEIGEAWAESGGDNSSANWTIAKNLSEYYFELLVPSHVGYRFYLDDDVLAQNTSRSDESSSVAMTHSFRLLVGYASGQPLRGNVARATILDPPASVDYGNVHAKAVGCNWTIEFEDLSLASGLIPQSYNGSLECNYTGATPAGEYDPFDAYAEATARLLRELDSDSDGLVDQVFNPAAVELEVGRSGGVRSLWGPAKAKIVLWM